MKLEWRNSGSAELISFEDGDRVVLLSTIPAAPGTPLEGLTDSGERYFVKVRTAKRVEQDPARYRIEGRLYNLTRERRERILKSFGGE